MNRFEPYLSLLKQGLENLDGWRESFGEDVDKEFQESSSGSIEKQLAELAEKLKGNYPFHHPVYAGQMLKPPHPAAWLAYSLAMTINPNNHALDGGPPTSEMEKKVMDQMAAMCGYSENYLGHLTSGGTIANLEALWIARELHPGKAIASTAQAHYTHSRMCRVLNTKHLTVPVNSMGEPDIIFLEENSGEIGTLVLTLGTTGMGNVEPVHDLKSWADRYGIRIHLDAAYGGFYKIIAGDHGLDPAPWNLMGEADSIVIDPHKHGLQPYGCGSVLFRDPAVGRFYKHDSPYTYFTSGELHLGEITLECSRAGASAAALWLTLQLLPLNRSGLGKVLSSCRKSALALSEKLNTSDYYTLFKEPDLDIVIYFPNPEKKTTSSISDYSRNIFNAGMNDAKKPLYLSLYKTSADRFCKVHPEYDADTGEVVLLRSVLMKPEHETFLIEIAERLENLAGAVKKNRG